MMTDDVGQLLKHPFTEFLITFQEPEQFVKKSMTSLESSSLNFLLLLSILTRLRVK